MRRGTWKLKLLALGVGLCAASQASALLTIDGDGNSTQWLFVWDAAGDSYYRALTVGNPPGGTTPILGNMFTNNPEFTSGYTGPITYATDSNFAAFLALPNVAANPSALQWGVFTQNDQQATIDMTVASPPPGVVPLSSMLTANISGDTFLAEINSQCPAGPPAATSCVVLSTASNGKANEPSWGNNVGGNMPVNAMTGINNTQMTYWHFDSGVGTVTQYMALGQATDYRILSDGTLIYEVSAVPEASTLAMFAAGLAVVGGIARRRLA